jgi:hypothetical protein
MSCNEQHLRAASRWQLHDHTPAGHPVLSAMSCRVYAPSVWAAILPVGSILYNWILAIKVCTDASQLLHFMDANICICCCFGVTSLCCCYNGPASELSLVLLHTAR